MQRGEFDALSTPTNGNCPLNLDVPRQFFRRSVLLVFYIEAARPRDEAEVSGRGGWPMGLLAKHESVGVS